MLSKELRRCTPERALRTLDRAADRSATLIETAKRVIDSFSEEKGLNAAGICFVVVGSVGRKEALEASDFDFIPVTDSLANLEVYQPHGVPLRQALTDALGAKVSKGEDLTMGFRSAN